MEHYKQINSTLIAKVQELKLHIACYQKELVESRRQALEERTLRVESEHRIIRSIASFCFRAVKEVDDSVDICSIFDEIRENRTPERDRSFKFDDRNLRSSIAILDQFRRSNVCRNVVTASPTRRRTSGSIGISDLNDSSSDIETGEELQNSKSEEDEDEDEAEADADEDKDNGNGFSLRLNDIVEDEESISDIESLNSSGVEDLDEQQEIKVDQENLRKDTGNKAADMKMHESGKQEQISSVKGALRNLTNNIHQSPEITKKNTGAAVLTPPSLRQRLKSNSELTHEISIEAVRCENSRKQHNGEESNEVTLTPPAMPSPSNTSKYSMRSTSSLAPNETASYSFNTKPCSTPLTMKELHGEQTESTEQHNGSDATTVCSARRPQRRCTPRSFVEPKVNQKMRNDNGKVSVDRNEGCKKRAVRKKKN